MCIFFLSSNPTGFGHDVYKICMATAWVLDLFFVVTASDGDRVVFETLPLSAGRAMLPSVVFSRSAGLVSHGKGGFVPCGFGLSK